jgi:hypothetical protein
VPQPTPRKAAKAAPKDAALRKFVVSGLAAVALSTTLACGSAGTEQPDQLSPGGAAGTGGQSTGSAAGTSGQSTGGSASVDPITPVNPLGRERCRAPAGTTGSPGTVAEAVALMNALPKPTSVACFVEALDRPLGVYATQSIISAQPALSAQSPRVFIKKGLLWLSVVVDGESSYLVEFGQLINETDLRSLKGELKLPLEEVISPTLPFERVGYGSGTVCGLCHSDEREHIASGLAGVFDSAALRPRPETRIDLETLRALNRECDWEFESHRCEMLSALLEGGTVVEAPFPDAMPTFY